MPRGGLACEKSRCSSEYLNRIFEEYLIFYQILSTNSSRKCLETSLENLHVDIDA